MQRRHLWFAASFAFVPVLVFACGGGRSDIDLLLESGGGAGAAGKGGGAGAGGLAGAGGAGAGGAAAGEAGSGGAKNCAAGLQVECACPGTPLKGVQVCLADGSAFGPCSGCPAGEGGGSGSGGAGGSGGAAGGGTAGVSGSGQGGEPADGGVDFFDALPFPLPDSGPVGECVGCLQENCSGSINQCYNDSKCVDGIQCAITDCFAGSAIGGGQGPGGGLDFACLLGCFGGDPTAVFAAVQAFQCITQTCGDKCGGGILGDGGFPLGGLGGGPTPPEPPVPGAMYMQGVRVPRPEEVPGYPRLQQALSPRWAR